MAGVSSGSARPESVPVAGCMLLSCHRKIKEKAWKETTAPAPLITAAAFML
jgi:hypothetical protein